MTPAPATHPPEASFHHIHPHPLVAHPGDTVGQVRARLRQRRADQAWSLLCVLDGDGRLLGTLAPQALAALDDAARVDEAMEPHGPRVTPGMDQEEMASWALHRTWRTCTAWPASRARPMAARARPTPRGRWRRWRRRPCAARGTACPGCWWGWRAACSPPLMLPWALQRLKLDPAYGSGPLATIVQDVLSLLIYFGFATALLF
ncbi:magnesium transporter [Ideonella sp.]|uniref:magnesium transporter n=1 Tax=Ideonella sp. TaxID=1929293 RepID=UPI0035B28EA1